MKNTILAAVAAAVLVVTTNHSPAADSAAEQLETVTTAMNSIPDVIFYKDLDDVYRGGNTAWAALLGKPLDELIGKTDAELFPAEVAASFRADDQTTLAGGKARRFQEWLVYPDGRKVYVNTLKAPWIGKDGKVLGVVGICYEFTAPAEEKSAQEK